MFLLLSTVSELVIMTIDINFADQFCISSVVTKKTYKARTEFDLVNFVLVVVALFM